MQILIFSGLENDYYILAKENVEKIPSEILKEIPDNPERLFNDDIEVLYSRGFHPEVEQIKFQFPKSKLLNKLEENGFLKVVL
ncbi:hypothetical protein R4487_08745 [Acinetobacter baumannii]|nr:hypothetical protein [Acinetobacter baumannii]